MIPFLYQQSETEVLDDFFQRFKNCNTISREDIWGDCSLLLPKGVSPGVIINDLGKVRGERYLIIINSLYFRGLYRKKTRKEEGNFLPIHRDTLMELGGNRYKELLTYGIKKLDQIIQSPKRYVVGVKCNEYRLNEKIFNMTGQETYTLTTKPSIAVWKNRHTRQRKSFEERSPGHRKICQSTDGLTFDYLGSLKYVDSIQNMATKLQRISVLLDLMSNGQVWSVDKQIRNYTKLVVVPRDLRRFFSYKGSPLFSVDIKSSQPLLHSLLYPDNDHEKKKYLDAVQTDFWEYMNDAAGKPYDLTDSDEKDLLKEKMWSQVFYGWKQEEPNPRSKFAVVFEKEFPSLWKEIQKAKTKGMGNLPREMQFLEADQVMSVVGKLSGKPYPLITIHDCIVTTKDGVEDVKKGLKSEFSQWGLSPVLTVKPLTE